MEDNYLALREYEERIADSKSSIHKDFIEFKHSDGLYYFAWLKSGQIFLRGEGYSTIPARDNAILSVLKNKGDKNNYRTESAYGDHFLVLLGENNREIARSYPMKQEIETFIALNAIDTDDDNSPDSLPKEIELTGNNTAPKDETDVVINQVSSKTEDSIELVSPEEPTKIIRSPLLDSFTKNLSVENSPVENDKKSDENQDISELNVDKDIHDSLSAENIINDPDTDIEDSPSTEGSVEMTKIADELYAGTKPDIQDKFIRGKALEDHGNKRNYGRWLLWLLLILVLGGAAWWLWQMKGYEKIQHLARQYNILNSKDNAPKSKIKSDTLSADKATLEAKARWEKTLGGMVNIYLPDGSKLTVPEYGTEKKLVEYLESKCGTSELKKTWFDMDRILFKSGTDVLSEVSDEQITLLAKIFKSYPNKKFKIGGYTDNVGNPEDNIRLSAIRAAAAMRAISAKGIDSTRMRFEGYGQEHPLCPENDTEECRAKNRRIAIRVDVCK